MLLPETLKLQFHFEKLYCFLKKNVCSKIYLLSVAFRPFTMSQDFESKIHYIKKGKDEKIRKVDKSHHSKWITWHHFWAIYEINFLCDDENFIIILFLYVGIRSKELWRAIEWIFFKEIFSLPNELKSMPKIVKESFDWFCALKFYIL